MSKQQTISDTKQNNVSSKLRRLKIEENILLKAIKKLDQKSNHDDIDQDIIASDLEIKNTAKTCIDSYNKIKTLFDDIKIITNSQELLADIEIDEIKMKVMELEAAMRSFQSQLENEIVSLKSSETILMKEMEETHRGAMIKKHPKLYTSASLKQAVISPVQLLMTSPFKCTEVQEFQDFMKNSPNRYGGWNEYHHNVFVTLWKKYFGNSLSVDSKHSEITTNLVFDNFIDECLLKLQGMDRTKLISHIDWYNKYLFLKLKQQIAIDKWKSNRRSMKKIPDNLQNSVQNEITTRKKLCEITKNKEESPKATSKVISSEDIERLMKPTMQWLSRCYDDDQIIEQFHDIENLEKLGVPNWRQNI